MKKHIVPTARVAGLFLLALVAGHRFAAQIKRATAADALQALKDGAINIDYPEEGSVFPPEISAPTFHWRDSAEAAKKWRIDITFEDGSAAIRTESDGPRYHVGEIDPRCVADTNELPKPTRQQLMTHTWRPDSRIWTSIKNGSMVHPATIMLSGFDPAEPERILSKGRVTLHTSKDPVGAPIFYRDVPLMPSETEKGVIKPIASHAVRLIAWRLRDIAEPQSRLLMENLPTCANCHSFSSDGRTLGMDMDGPQNDKGMYALKTISAETSIRTQDVIEWSSVRGKLRGKLRVGFMSQVSPDGQFVVTTIRDEAVEYTTAASSSNDTPRRASRNSGSNYYVANFADYRFLQVFYPTQGILAWYSRKTGRLQPLPGADDPHYVQASAFWSPDGKYLVFIRAEARDPDTEGAPVPKYANDPNELQIRYDLYRVSFNEGNGGAAEPILGASQNGWSNNFPKVSPDGRWIVFVQCRNGQLMRPDSRLAIVPAAGGEARIMRCNTSRMNSWHSFSPNGRWLVFSSKARSPYTQMYLTHLDEEGMDSPPILIENATAANRAVNIPEFVNIPPSALRKIAAPAVDLYRLVDYASDLQVKGDYPASITAWKKVLQVMPKDATAEHNLGSVLYQAGQISESIAHFRRAIELRPDFVQAHCSLGGALAMTGKLEEALVHLRSAAEADPDYAPYRNNLGMTLVQTGQAEEAIVQFRKATEIQPDFVQALCNLGSALAMKGNGKEALALLRRAQLLDPSYVPAYYNLGLVLSEQGDREGAVAQWRKALEIQPRYSEARHRLAEALYSQGKTAEALQHWRAGLTVKPDDLPALSRTAWLLATCSDGRLRHGSEAIELALRAAHLSNGKDPEVLDTLAAAYAETGRFSEAVQTARRALAIAVQKKLQAHAERLQARIALYLAERPFRGIGP